MTLAEAAREMVRAIDAHAVTRKVQSAAWIDRHCDYRAVGVAEGDAYAGVVRARGVLLAVLKAALSADDVRRAAEAGSPAARMLEPNGGKR